MNICGVQMYSGKYGKRRWLILSIIHHPSSISRIGKRRWFVHTATILYDGSSIHMATILSVVFGTQHEHSTVLAKRSCFSHLPSLYKCEKAPDVLKSPPPSFLPSSSFLLPTSSLVLLDEVTREQPPPAPDLPLPPIFVWLVQQRDDVTLCEEGGRKGI